jgi:hypothetical protein
MSANSSAPPNFGPGTNGNFPPGFQLLSGNKSTMDAWNAQHAPTSPDQSVGKKGGAPPPPNYAGSAAADAASSTANTNAQTQANRPNISGPFANQQWTKGPDGSWQLTSGFSGPLGGAANSAASNAAFSLGQPIDNGSAARDQAIRGAYGQSTSRLDPQFAEQSGQLDSRLAAQGLDPNSEAARTARADFGRNKNDAYQSALNNAIGQGTAAQQATFGENLAAREAPLSELQGLQGLTQTPQFNAAGVAQPTQNLAASIASGNFGLQNQAQQNQIFGDILGGATGLAGSAAKFFSMG